MSDSKNPESADLVIAKEKAYIQHGARDLAAGIVETYTLLPILRRYVNGIRTERVVDLEKEFTAVKAYLQHCGVVWVSRSMIT